ncbi:MAG: glutamine amidotransferase [Planctomycetaceae bacterium]
MSLTLEPIWSWPFLLLLGAGLAALVVVSYRGQRDRLPNQRRRAVVLGFKLAALAALLFAMFRPAIQYAETTENLSQILLVRDLSRSMNTADGPGGKTRWEAMQEDWKRTEPLLEKLGPRVEIRKFDFAAELSPYSTEATAGDGDQTAIGQTLSDLAKAAEDRRTLAILLWTDGAQRALPPHDIDPLIAAEQLAEAQAPVYPIGYGASAISQAALDLAVEDLSVDPVVFENKQVPIRVRLRAAGAKGKTATVRILVEPQHAFGLNTSQDLIPATAAQQARPVWETELKTDKESLLVDLTFVPHFAGELKIAVEAVPVEGELLTRNNRVERIVTVRKGGVRVAYFDTWRDEIKSLQMVNGADKIQLDVFRLLGGEFAARAKLPAEWFERGKYDVYVIGDIPAKVFGPALLEKLAERLRDGAGLLMTGGTQNFSAGDYADTPLADFLPVILNPGLSRAGNTLQTQIGGRVKMLPTASGLQQYVMQIDAPEKNRARWQALPALKGATKLTPKPDLVDIWAETEDGLPLLVASTVGRARVAAFGGDSTWLWVLHQQGDAHQRFWRQLLLWLARKDADTDQAVWVKVDPRNFIPGAAVPLVIGARDAEGAPLEDVDFQVEVISPKNQLHAVAPHKTAQAYFAEFLETTEPGDYWVRVSGIHQGKSLGPATQTRFIVDHRDLELDHPSADYDLLRQIAAATGGASLKPEELPGWAARLTERKFGDLTQVHTLPLWDNWWSLLAFVGLMTCEWTLRKRWGLV